MAIIRYRPLVSATDIDAEQWRSVFRQLVARGYISVDVGGFGGLHLTDKSRPLLKGEERLDLHRDVKETYARKSKEKKSKTERNIDEADRPLWTALRQCRKQLADEQGVPPFVIFHDATLVDMLHYRPSNDNELLALSGVGNSKLERYGEAFLAVIREYEALSLME